MYDVAVIGAGAAGTLAAAMLGRQGYTTCLIDPNSSHNPEFRCEKLEPDHVKILQQAGVLEDVLPAGRRYDSIWVAWNGRLAEKRSVTEYGFEYHDLVNTLRNALPASVDVIKDKVVGAIPDERTTELKLATGTTLNARIVIAATGLNQTFLTSLGMRRNVISQCHSVSIAFYMAPKDRPTFDFDSLTYFGEHPNDKIAYLTIFPLKSGIRANMFVYHTKGDPWFSRIRENPVATLHESLPNLKAITGDFDILDRPRLRPMDLVKTENIACPGIVLIGDAYATVCPVTGSGAVKAFHDAERLCSVYVPKWLRDGKVPATSIQKFYRDPLKQRRDRTSNSASLTAKHLMTDTRVHWQAYRRLRNAALYVQHVLFGLGPVSPL